MKLQQALELTKLVLEEYRFRTSEGPPIFPLVATNGQAIILVYETGHSSTEAVGDINRNLSTIFFQKRFGPQTREIYVLLLFRDSLTDSDLDSIENDSRICRKLALSLDDTKLEQSLRTKLLFLKPISLAEKALPAISSMRQLYIETFAQTAAGPSLEILMKILDSGWKPDDLLRSMKEEEK
jgi:hypothetical protein